MDPKTIGIAVISMIVLGSFSWTWSKADTAFTKASVNESKISDIHEGMTRIENKLDRLIEKNK